MPPARKQKTLPLKVVCLLMLQDWLEEKFGSFMFRSIIMTSPFPPNFNVGWDTHRCSRKGVFFFLVAGIYPQNVILSVNIEFGGKGGAQKILTSVRHKSWKSNRVAVAVITRSVFFLRGGVIQITFHPKLKHCHSIRPANKACVSVCQLTRQTTK